MNKRVIFIAGASHSGSTLLGCILGSHPDNPFQYFHVGEVHAFFSSTHEKYGKPYGAIQAGGTIWNDIDYSLGPSGAYAELFRASGTDVLIDSSKNIKWLHSQYLICRQKGWDFQIVVSYRPFGGIWSSSEKRKDSVNKNISNLMYYHHLLSEIKKIGIDIDVLDLRLLVEEPSIMTQLLCAKTNILYFPGKEYYWNFMHFHLFGAAAQRKDLKDPSVARYYQQNSSSYSIDQLPVNVNQKKCLYDAENFLKNRIIGK